MISTDLFPYNPKLAPLPEAVARRQQWFERKESTVMTNGCFDLLHTGHLHFLQEARRLGDRLIVLLNSDASVRQLKGPKRPVQTEQERAFALAALQCVDLVVIFRTPQLVAEIAALKPELYTKAGDYSLERLHPGERATLEGVGTRITFLPFLPGFSTTSLIGKIAAAGSVD